MRVFADLVLPLPTSSARTDSHFEGRASPFFIKVMGEQQVTFHLPFTGCPFNTFTLSLCLFGYVCSPRLQLKNCRMFFAPKVGLNSPMRQPCINWLELQLFRISLGLRRLALFLLVLLSRAGLSSVLTLYSGRPSFPCVVDFPNILSCLVVLLIIGPPEGRSASILVPRHQC